nr:PREDICTED: proline-rich membrane anchor 1 isoform X2 [Lepisosteus oculatus]
MLLRDILPLSLSSWPFLFGHCFLTSFLLLFQFTQGELQKSCSRTIAEKASESCQLTCQCRPYPPLPPPPPPPPPPRLLVSQTPTEVQAQGVSLHWAWASHSQPCLDPVPGHALASRSVGPPAIFHPRLLMDQHAGLLYAPRI